MGSVLSHVDDLLLESEMHHFAGSSLRCLTSYKQPLSHGVLNVRVSFMVHSSVVSGRVLFNVFSDRDVFCVLVMSFSI